MMNIAASIRRSRCRILAVGAAAAAAVTLVPAATADTTVSVGFTSDTSWTAHPGEGGASIGNAQIVCLQTPCAGTSYGYLYGNPWGETPYNWIWAPGITGASRPAENAAYRFRKTVTLPAAATNISGQLYLTADDCADVWINGELVAWRPRVSHTVPWPSCPDSGGDGFAPGAAFAIPTGALHPGDNLIEIRAMNGPAGIGPYPSCSPCTYQDHPAGVVLNGSLTYDVPPDTAPPTVDLPANVATDATGRGGAVVDYAVTATDAVDGPVPVTCSPASGSTFPIGTTTVACTAADAVGNVGSGSFQVHVRGAPEQVADLIALVDSYNLRLLGAALHEKLVKVQEFLAANKPKRACEKLDSFLAQVKEQRGKRISVEQADRLTLDARRIKAVIGC